VNVDASEIPVGGTGKLTVGEEPPPPPHADNSNTLESNAAPLSLTHNLFDTILHSRPSRIVLPVATNISWLVDPNSAKTGSPLGDHGQPKLKIFESMCVALLTDVCD
jgi:hypothetical protein